MRIFNYLRRALTLAAPILLLGCGGHQSSQPADSDRTTLGCKFVPGARFTYALSYRREEPGPRGGLVGGGQTTTISFRVQAVHDHLCTLQATLDRVVLQADDGPQTSTYDSQLSDGPTNPLAAIRPQLHRPFTVVVTEAGELKDVSELPAAGPGSMAEMFSPGTTRILLLELFDIYPNPSVEMSDVPGKSWQKSRLAGLNGLALTRRTTYTQTGVSRGVAHVALAGQLTGLGPDPSPASGTEAGTFAYDAATGLLLDGTLTQTLYLPPAGTPPPAANSTPPPATSTGHKVLNTLRIKGQWQ